MSTTQNTTEKEKSLFVRFQDGKVRRWAVVDTDEEMENGNLWVLYRANYGHYQSAVLGPEDVLESVEATDWPNRRK